MAKPHESMVQVAEHQFFKAGLPLVTAALIGSVTYLFSTVLTLEKEVFLLKEGKIPVMEAKIEGMYKNIEKLEDKIMNVRMFHNSPNAKHPYNSPPEDYYNDGQPRNKIIK
tara:strand:+ start:599 stop:931 length:333 start_codon:yes stop_codon:yes gene_type:complete